jgi:hypothetical protein
MTFGTLVFWQLLIQPSEQGRPFGGANNSTELDLPNLEAQNIFSFICTMRENL